MQSYQLHKNIICIDLKSFYASVECSLLGLDPFTTPLVVADRSRGGGGVVLAISPYLKSLGVKSRCRIHELPTNISIIYRKPQMHTYLEYASKVLSIYLDYVSEEDLFVYSIDEAFLDLTSYLSYYKKTDAELAKDILKAIKNKLDLYATCGIGPNMLIAKLALDIESKKSPDFIAKWGYDDIKTKLWPIEPLSEMWGIGHRMLHNLNQMGLYKIGDIANYDVKKLKRKYGVLGEELYYHTHGIDMSILQDKDAISSPKNKSYGIGQTLYRDYHVPDIFQVIREMADDVARRLRMAKKQASTISFGIGYSKAYGGGFSRQQTIEVATASPTKIYEICLGLLNEFYEGFPIRKVHISVSQMCSNHAYQLNLFEDIDIEINETKVHKAVDEIKDKYGKNSVLRASSGLESSTIKKRNEMIGGHNA